MTGTKPTLKHVPFPVPVFLAFALSFGLGVQVSMATPLTF